MVFIVFKYLRTVVIIVKKTLMFLTKIIECAGRHKAIIKEYEMSRSDKTESLVAL